LQQIIKDKLTALEINNKREQVAQLLKKTSPHVTDDKITSLADSDLQLLFNAYDQVFFQDWFRDQYPGQIKFSLSRRMTKSAGITICPKSLTMIEPEKLVIEIRIGVDFFFQYYQLGNQVIVCGLETSSSLQALQLVFEHEICHALEFILYHSSSCKRQRFKNIANNCFGHTSSLHQLPTYRQIAATKFGLQVGDQVAFTDDGRQLSGIISGINKNASVMVPDPKGAFADKAGRRYTKYYVALKRLNKR